MILPLFSSLLNPSPFSVFGSPFLSLCFAVGKQAQACQCDTGWGWGSPWKRAIRGQKVLASASVVARYSIIAGMRALGQCCTWLVVPGRLFWLWLDFSPIRHLASVMPCFVLKHYIPIKLPSPPKPSSKPLK